MTDDPMKRGAKEIRKNEKARAARKQAIDRRKFTYLKDFRRDLPLLLERRLNDLKRQAHEQGYPIQPDPDLPALSEDEFRYMLRVVNS